MFIHYYMILLVSLLLSRLSFLMNCESSSGYYNYKSSKL
uniref:Uncharacterized protein n=1 Tax=Rhizophora mucronata TaxID=61149 RepID=A0A2P2KB66_RHIMU